MSLLAELITFLRYRYYKDLAPTEPAEVGTRSDGSFRWPALLSPRRVQLRNAFQSGVMSEQEDNGQRQDGDSYQH